MFIFSSELIHRKVSGLIKTVNHYSKKKMADIFFKSWRITGLAFNHVSDNL